MIRDMSRDEKTGMIKKMADLLRAGATMLGESCPACGSPLFRLRSGEIVCPIHGRVHVVRSDEEISKVTLSSVLDNLENVMTRRIQDAIDNLNKSRELGNEEDLRNIVLMLEIIERIERVKKTLQPSMISTGKDKEKKTS